MPEAINFKMPLIFGLDIGTRSIVGTVGYKEQDTFNVIGQCVKYHDTRAMLDGQIHDINKVAQTIVDVKKDLEDKLKVTLKDVCIAAAGRVLKTEIGTGFMEFSEDKVITLEDIYSLDMLGVEDAYNKVNGNGYKEKFFNVGYSVVNYYLNDNEISNLEGHKASSIKADVLTTFLPEDVIEGLYAVIDKASLQVANLTLEPIAAINVAIPKQYRLLNIALIDVGAGTSDICITKDGSIIGYGMIPAAGDEITEVISKKYLVDFNTAEKMKTVSQKKKSFTYKDIMGITHKITPAEINETAKETIEKITTKIADKIVELNGNKSVSAAFIVGGGGKLPEFATQLASKLELPDERVALRGEEVLNTVNFLNEKPVINSLMVTPVGICLSFYEQNNHFIYVQVNEKRVKLYDNNHLTVFDAALEYGLSKDALFPRRGESINYSVNGKKRRALGTLGEACIITLDDKEVGMTSQIESNVKIQIKDSTVGDKASITIGQLVEYKSTISFNVNNNLVVCPKFVSVNNNLESEFYEIKDEDEIEILDYYTLEQLLTFMDLKPNCNIYVNNQYASDETKIYENFSIMWDDHYDVKSENVIEDDLNDQLENDDIKHNVDNNSIKNSTKDSTNGHAGGENLTTSTIQVMINNNPVVLTGKREYRFVDVFDFYEFDLTRMNGKELITKVNGKDAKYLNSISDGDIIELEWI